MKGMAPDTRVMTTGGNRLAAKLGRDAPPDHEHDNHVPLRETAPATSDDPALFGERGIGRRAGKHEQRTL